MMGPSVLHDCQAQHWHEKPTKNETAGRAALCRNWERFRDQTPGPCDAVVQ